ESRVGELSRGRGGSGNHPGTSGTGGTGKGGPGSRSGSIGTTGTGEPPPSATSFHEGAERKPARSPDGGKEDSQPRRETLGKGAPDVGRHARFPEARDSGTGSGSDSRPGRTEAVQSRGRQTRGSAP